MLSRVGEHQHQLAHQCSSNRIGIWEWGIYDLMGGGGIYGLMGWAFMTQWVGHLSLNGQGAYHLMGRAFMV